MTMPEKRKHVGRGALKLEAALEAFRIEPAGKVAADLGSSTGGFTQVLLEHGAAKVYALDTAYGQLDWSLRNDDRVVVMERVNALHAELPEAPDLITIDTGWTPQHLILESALRLLKPDGEIVSLLKPHYEAKRQGVRFRGKKLDPDESRAVMEKVRDELEKMPLTILKIIESPIAGGKGGNIEYLLWIKPKKK